PDPHHLSFPLGNSADERASPSVPRGSLPQWRATVKRSALNLQGRLARRLEVRWKHRFSSKAAVSARNALGLISRSAATRARRDLLLDGSSESTLRSDPDGRLPTARPRRGPRSCG